MSATTLHEFSIHKPSSFSSAYRHLLSPVYRSTSCSLIVLDVVQLAYNSAYGIRIEDMPLCTRYESTYESLRDPYWCTLSRTIAIVTFPCPAQHQQSQQLPLPRSTFETNFPNEKIPTNFISSSQLFKALSDYTRNTDHTEGIEKKKKNLTLHDYAIKMSLRYFRHYPPVASRAYFQLRPNETRNQQIWSQRT